MADGESMQGAEEEEVQEETMQGAEEEESVQSAEEDEVQEESMQGTEEEESVHTRTFPTTTFPSTSVLRNVPSSCPMSSTIQFYRYTSVTS